VTALKLAVLRKDDKLYLLRLIQYLSFILLASLAFAQAAPSGIDVFAASCASCHQADGTGLPGIFPPLAGHVSELYSADGGPQYLASVVLFGLQGPLTIKGQTYDGVMPGWFQLGDEEVAVVLDYAMTAWDDQDTLGDDYIPITAADVASARRRGLSPQLVYQSRPALEDAAGTGAIAVALSLPQFSAEQVERIRPVYDRYCSDCHGEDLNGGLIGGPPLRGSDFERRWNTQSVAALFLYTQARMPQDRPGSLSAQQYADLVALILSENGLAAGTSELPSDPTVLEGFGIDNN
jgi:mono/diheme cytochrome c family protein